MKRTGLIVGAVVSMAVLMTAYAADAPGTPSQRGETCKALDCGCPASPAACANGAGKQKQAGNCQRNGKGNNGGGNGGKACTQPQNDQKQERARDGSCTIISQAETENTQIAAGKARIRKHDGTC